ncbi:MBL fold metallo-hydrolase [Chitinivorax sp. PXF-14]|uniref:MBL fold metallo-hydrolase n=1 Tax=Chitinivorax sp. PXF-14 TaxID=3230488 RepID=UPI003465A1F5
MTSASPSDHALDFPLGDQLPAAGTCLQVADGVYWLRMPLPFALDHINLWLLRDGEGWAIVDTGYGKPATRELWEQVFAHGLEGRPVTRVLLTHNHPDHIGNADWLAQRWNAPVWASEGEFLQAHLVWHDLAGFNKTHMVEQYRAHGVDEALLQLLATRGNSYRWGVPSLPATFRRIMPHSVIEVDGCDWHVIVGYGHSPEHVALYCEQKGVLISGDMLLPTISTNVGVWATEPDGDPLKAFLSSIRHFLPLPADTLVLPSHGRPFKGIQARVAALEAHHADRLEVLRQFCAEPRQTIETLQVLFGRELDAYQLFFAMGEAIAHLNHLMHRGQLVRETGTDGRHRFRMAG